MANMSCGPSTLGLDLDPDATVVDGWLSRSLRIPAGLDGPRGILQGGFAAGVLAGIARAADTFDAPLTLLDARLLAPTPTPGIVESLVRPGDGVATFDARVRRAGRTLVDGRVELAGHEPHVHAHDLAELAAVPLPAPVAQERYATCWSCGAHAVRDDAQHVYPGWRDAQTVVAGWIPADVLADGNGHVHPIVVSAMLDCSAAWACIAAVDAMGMRAAMLGGIRIRFVREVPVMEPVRIVARHDATDGRKLRVRAAIVDDDGAVCAVADTLQIAVLRLADPA